MTTTTSWQNRSLVALPSGAEPPSVLLCTPVWGAEYVRVFCDLVLPTLLAPGNLPVFAGRMQCIFLIYTSHDSESLLRSSSTFQKLTSLLEVRLHFVEDLEAEAAGTYGMLTACYNDAIRIGAEHRQALIFLNADMIYSSGTFASIVKRIDEGKRCIEIDGFRTKKQGMEADLLRKAGDIIDIPSGELVGLALKHIHSISQSHFWETEADIGFIPFHTYWRAGKYGLVGKISHLYPLYLYPRRWDDLSSAKTIDWDLIDRAGLRAEDIHLVLDSEELFAAELSDENYSIAPRYPKGGTVEGMREFIGANCAPHHRDCLKYSSRLRVRAGNSFSWWWTELKAWIWYKAVCDQSSFCTALVWLLGWPSKVRGVSRGFLDEIRLLLIVLRSSDRTANQTDVLRYLMGCDPAPYLALMQAAPTSLRGQFRKRGLPIPFSRKKLRSIDAEYARICLDEDSPVPMEPQSNLVLSRDAFFGTGWRTPKNFPARQISRDGSASIFVRLPQKRAYRAVLSVGKIPFDIGNNLRLDINGEFLSQQIVEMTDIWRVSGVIPPSIVADHEGRIKLTVRLADERGRPCGDVFITRIQISPFASVQESVFEQRGLSTQLYASFRNLSEEYTRIYDSCDPDLEWDAQRAQSWISALNDVLSSQIMPLHALPFGAGGDIALSGEIPGYGWGDAGIWGSQSFRWLNGRRCSSLFFKVIPGRAYLAKVYLHTCTQDVLRRLRLSINHEVMLSQGLHWDTDRYFLWVDIPAKTTAQSGGLVELSISVGAADINPERLAARQRLRKMVEAALSLSPLVKVTRTAFSRLLVVEHDMISTRAEVLALQLRRS
jgi:hypothetical protein